MTVDLSRFWETLPCKDIEESKRSKQAATTPPAISIGQVTGDVITVNIMAGASADLAGLRSGAKEK